MLRRIQEPVVWVSGLLLFFFVAGGSWLAMRLTGQDPALETPEEIQQEVPEELERHREAFQSGVEAVLRNDGEEAAKSLASFELEGHAVEEYRLYYLANALELDNRHGESRRTLGKLWERGPRMVYRSDSGFHLASKYSEGGYWYEAQSVLNRLLEGGEAPAVEALARQRLLDVHLASGNLAGVVAAAHSMIVQTPGAPQAETAELIVKAVRDVPPKTPLPLDLSERIDRARNLTGQGRADAAVALLQPIDAESLPSPLAERVLLARGEALRAAGRYRDSEEALSTLFSSYFKYAIPALEASWKNNMALGDAIKDVETRTRTVRKRVGTVKVRQKGKLVSKPRYRNVRETVQVKIKEAAEKKEHHDRLVSERLKDLLELPLETELRIRVLETLIARAEAKGQDEYMKELIPRVVRLDSSLDPGLQWFWDKAWAAYRRGDMAGAAEDLEFIFSTYTNPNIRRQARYWYARTLERRGEGQKAKEIYQSLVEVPYTDVYALFAVQRGAKQQPVNPLQSPFAGPVGQHWNRVVEQALPPELELAWELNVLGLARDARAEIRRHQNRSNRMFSNAILADLYYADGALLLTSRALRRAFPEIGTAEQNRVPPRYLRMYYPTLYHDHVERFAEKRSLDPALPMAIILQESNYEPTVRSGAGAVGLMQVMPPTAREIADRIGLATRDLTDPAYNIELGVYYIKHLLNLMEGNDLLAIASYNAGMGNVGRWKREGRSKPFDELIEDIPFSETRGYVKRVTLYRSAYDQIRKIPNQQAARDSEPESWLSAASAAH